VHQLLQGCGAKTVLQPCLGVGHGDLGKGLVEPDVDGGVLAGRQAGRHGVHLPPGLVAVQELCHTAVHDGQGRRREERLDAVAAGHHRHGHRAHLHQGGGRVWRGSDRFRRQGCFGLGGGCVVNYWVRFHGGVGPGRQLFRIALFREAVPDVTVHEEVHLLCGQLPEGGGEGVVAAQGVGKLGGVGDRAGDVLNSPFW